MTIVTRSPGQTATIGRALGEICRGGDVIVLDGELGAGKTTLVQGLAAGLGVADQVVSPTFTLLREYDGHVPLYHFDFYRLQGAGRAAQREFGEYLDAGGVCVVEWSAHAPDFAPRERLALHLEVRHDAERAIRVDAAGARYDAHLRALAPYAMRESAAP